MTITQQVRTWLQSNPAIARCLHEDLVNLSALARRMQEDLSVERPQSIVTALRRIRRDQSQDTDDGVQEALAASRVEMRTHAALLTYHASWSLLQRLAGTLAGISDDERVHVFHGWEDITVVADEELIETLEAAVGDAPLERRTGLVELNLRSDQASVPGFLAATTTALAAKGINLIDAASCRMDHIFLIEERDLPHAISALDSLRN